MTHVRQRKIAPALPDHLILASVERATELVDEVVVSLGAGVDRPSAEVEGGNVGW